MEDDLPDRPSHVILVGSVVFHDVPNAESTIKDVLQRADETGLIAGNKKRLGFANQSIYEDARYQIALHLNLAHSMQCFDRIGSSIDKPLSPSEKERVIELQKIFNFTKMLQNGDSAISAIEALKTTSAKGTLDKANEALLDNILTLESLFVEAGLSREDAQTLVASEVAAIELGIQSRERDQQISTEKATQRYEGRINDPHLKMRVWESA